MMVCAAAAACLAGLGVLLSGRVTAAPDGWWWRAQALLWSAWVAAGVAAVAAVAGARFWWAWAGVWAILLGAGAEARMLAHAACNREFAGEDDGSKDVEDVSPV